MFQSGPGSAKGGKGRGGQSSESDSDWDTTVDFPTPSHAAVNNAAQDSDHDDFPAQPTPKTRASLADTGKQDRTGDGVPYSARREEDGPVSSRKTNKAPASASAVRLSPFDSDTRNPSPTPPYTSGFQNAIKNNRDIQRGGSPSPMGMGRQNNRYELSPTPKIPASMDVPLSQWDDSDAEQQTLHELHATLKKEKTREMENEAARKQLQGDVDRSQATDYNSSSTKRQKEQKIDGSREKSAQDTNQLATVDQEQKSGRTGLSPNWLQRSNYNDNAMPVGVDDTYKPFVVKNPDGKRYLYFFSEGSTSFYEVEEEESEAVMPKVAEKVEGYIKRGWQEFFGLLRILVSVVILLAVEALRFLTDHIARPLFLVVITTVGNGLVKPILAGVFNLVFQPFVVFLWNLVSGVRHVSQPLIDILGAVMSKLATLLQAFRLVEVNLGQRYHEKQRVIGFGGDGSFGGGGKRESEIV